jgi:hypothetical protein
MAANTLETPPRTLADVWMHASLRAPGWALKLACVAGVAGMAGISFGYGRWSYSLALILIGCFGARGLELSNASRGRGILSLLDTIAVVAAVVLVLRILGALFGGTVGLMRA